jgi:hypothetical protein
MTDRQRAEIVDSAIRKARGNRRLRQQFGLGIIGWITIGVQVIQLVMQILELLKDRETIAGQFGASRVQSYQIARDQGHDADLVAVVEEADLEVLGR